MEYVEIKQLEALGNKIPLGKALEILREKESQKKQLKDKERKTVVVYSSFWNNVFTFSFRPIRVIHASHDVYVPDEYRRYTIRIAKSIFGYRPKNKIR